jgi:hypothetical protein
MISTRSCADRGTLIKHLINTGPKNSFDIAQMTKNAENTRSHRPTSS